MVKYPEDVGYIDKYGQIKQSNLSKGIDENRTSDSSTTSTMFDDTTLTKLYDSIEGAIKLSDGTELTLADLVKDIYNLNENKTQSNSPNSHEENLSSENNNPKSASDAPDSHDDR